jgi:alpha-ketoglutarate-dependent taurine dioxygenase
VVDLAAGQGPVPQVVEALRERGLAFLSGVDGPEAMLGLAAHLMTVVAHPDDDALGITTLTDLGPAGNGPNAAGFSARALPAHTDRSGVPDPPGLLMLVCAVPADSGGASLLADGRLVHEHLAAAEPQALTALHQPRTVLYGGGAGHLACVFATDPASGRIRARLRLDDLASFAPDVAAWIPTLATAIDRHSTTVTLRPGDGMILDNHRWFHARQSFTGPRRMHRILGDPLPHLDIRTGIPTNSRQPGR